MRWVTRDGDILIVEGTPSDSTKTGFGKFPVIAEVNPIARSIVNHGAWKKEGPPSRPIDSGVVENLKLQIVGFRAATSPKPMHLTWNQHVYPVPTHDATSGSLPATA